MISPKCFDKGIILRDLPIDFFPVIVVVSQRCMNGGGFKLIFPHDLLDAQTQPKMQDHNIVHRDSRAAQMWSA